MSENFTEIAKGKFLTSDGPKISLKMAGILANLLIESKYNVVKNLFDEHNKYNIIGKCIVSYLYHFFRKYALPGVGLIKVILAHHFGVTKESKHSFITLGAPPRA